MEINNINENTNNVYDRWKKQHQIISTVVVVLLGHQISFSVPYNWLYTNYIPSVSDHISFLASLWTSTCDPALLNSQMTVAMKI